MGIKSSKFIVPNNVIEETRNNTVNQARRDEEKKTLELYIQERPYYTRGHERLSHTHTTVTTPTVPETQLTVMCQDYYIR